MALFTDGVPSGMEDLTAQDSQLLDVASTEGIDVARKLAATQEELGVELCGLLSGTSAADPCWVGGWVSSGVDLGRVVVTPALRLWHVYMTLEAIYGDAYNNQLNDRYAGKRDAFREKARWAREKVIELGIGLVWKPIPRAASPEVEAASGGMAAGVYYVSLGWVNESGEEGACGPPAVISIANGGLCVRPGAAPATATGWNVYVGDSAETMRRQNTGPIGIGAAWNQPPGLGNGGAPGSGQGPNRLQPVPRRIQRG